jgi:hypothetical protein
MSTDAAPGHWVEDPVWVIAASGIGGFVVSCTCGWRSPRFDISALARTAGRDHVAAVLPA